MKLKLIIALLSTCFALSSFAQSPAIDFNDYHMLQCSGTIPVDFRTLSQDKFKQDVSQEAKNSKGHTVSSSKQEFLLETNYIIDQLLLSGKVLFGDTVTDYINEVADKVLAEQPDLRNQLRFYCLRSSEANAFSTNQGIVFITLGLIAQLENEAQLAFVISHEVAHYEKKHTMNGYLENEKIFSKGGNYSYNSYDDKIRAASSYSKEMELQADSLGLIRLARTGYSCDEALSCMFVLQFSELPFEDFAFDDSFLQNSIMKFPKGLQLDSVRPIALDKDMEDDDYSTHPNIAKRKERLETILSGLNDCGVIKFALGETSFFTVRKICRFETVHIMLNRRDYCNAFYNTYILQHEDPESIYLKRCLAKALYGISKYKNHQMYSDVSTSYGKMEGNQQQVYYLFYKLTAPQVTMVALRYIYDLSLTDSSFYILEMRNDLAKEAVRIDKIHLADMKDALKIFDDAKNKPAIDSTHLKDSIASPVEPTYTSKYDKLRSEKKKQEQQKVTDAKISTESKFHLLAFADIIDTEKFLDFFSATEKEAEEQQEIADAEQARIDKMSDYEYRREQQNKANDLRKKGMQIGIDTVVYVDPFYYQADDRHGTKLIKSETEQLEFCNQIEENASYSGLSVQILNPKIFGENDVDKYNDLAIMNDWAAERLDHDAELNFIPIETDRALPLSKKYNTDHFCYSGIYTYKQRRDGRGTVLFLTILYFPLLPFGIAYALTPEYHTYYYTLMYNVTDGTADIESVLELKSKSRKGYINSQMYDMMLQMKTKKKKN